VTAPHSHTHSLTHSLTHTLLTNTTTVSQKVKEDSQCAGVSEFDNEVMISSTPNQKAIKGSNKKQHAIIIRSPAAKKCQFKSQKSSIQKMLKNKKC
jgi:hypothetical protein